MRSVVLRSKSLLGSLAVAAWLTASCAAPTREEAPPTPSAQAPRASATAPAKEAPVAPAPEEAKAAPKAQAPAPTAKAPAAAKPTATAAKPTATPAKPTATPSPPTAAAPPASASPAKPTLDLKSLEQRLKDTKAIGLMTKLAVKNQVDDLVDQFRAYHDGRRPPTLPDLRRPYELLLMKLLSLLQDKDPSLAQALNDSREAIWGILSDRDKFTQYS